MHGGGLASKKAKIAYDEFKLVSDRRSLGMKGALLHDPFVEGQQIRHHLRGVVGFCDIVIRIMTTIDAELSRSIQSEKILATRLRSVQGQPHMLSANEERRNEQVLKRCLAAKLPKPVDLSIVYKFLRAGFKSS